MTKARICFFELEKWEEPIIQGHFRQDELHIEACHLQDTPEEILKDCEILSAFVFSPLSASQIAKLPRLKMIATRSTGFDHIDLEACRKRGIHVANVPLYGEKTVAEHTFALLLALQKKLLQSVERTRSGSFSLDGLRGHDLNGKTLGIVGTGNIGRQVARIAHAFDMRLLACDIAPDPAWGANLGLRYVGLDELLSQSDIITLHAPGGPCTHHLINESHLPLIKKGALLINTARGSLVESSALVKGLSQGVFGGLGLDVLENEPIIREERELLSSLFQANASTLSSLLAEEFLLHHSEKVLITPHNAFNTQEAMERILQTTLENIDQFEVGQPVNSVL